eukprot:CAMPEP_0114552382 /NCGR_PEP_ID=MMETSP0114-20121206/7096_1 /TAXON_ID=31324 /ORGANISM="Goniomonas sp, Strain m" /LENGTH=95 /DNA_ID=CAMNT_0001737257 /DNA_START=29 /DNA_END=314 /DNA_ORIENTATION=-
MRQHARHREHLAAEQSQAVSVLAATPVQTLWARRQLETKSRSLLPPSPTLLCTTTQHEASKGNQDPGRNDGACQGSWQQHARHREHFAGAATAHQ